MTRTIGKISEVHGTLPGMVDVSTWEEDERGCRVKTYRGFDIQQDNSNHYAVVRIDSYGVRRSYYTADSVADAKRWIRDNGNDIR